MKCVTFATVLHFCNTSGKITPARVKAIPQPPDRLTAVRGASLFGRIYEWTPAGQPIHAAIQPRAPRDPPRQPFVVASDGLIRVPHGAHHFGAESFSLGSARQGSNRGKSWLSALVVDPAPRMRPGPFSVVPKVLPILTPKSSPGTPPLQGGGEGNPLFCGSPTQA